MDYVFDAGPSFRMTWGLRPTFRRSEANAFLALLWRIQDLAGFRFSQHGQLIVQGQIPEQNARVGETKRMAQPSVPDAMELFAGAGRDAEDRILSLSSLAVQAPDPPQNVFVHAPNLFIAWFDGDEQPCHSQWYEASALVTPGAAAPQDLPAPPWLGSERAEEQAGLADGSFEETMPNALSSLRSGERCPFRAYSPSPWHVPHGGSITSADVKRGRFAARVDNPSGAYALWRQDLSLTTFPPGSKARLSAWVKGESITRGEPTWKVGTLRLACGMKNGATRYVAASEMLGTFDWRKVEADVTILADTVALRLEVGLNGSTGTMWIDDVRCVGAGAK